MDAKLILVPLLIFALRMTDQSMATCRIIFIVKGRKFKAGAIGGVEVMIYVLAIGLVVTNLDNIINFIAYGAGFGTGTILGSVINDKFVESFVKVQIFSKYKSSEIARRLRVFGYGVTEIEGKGLDGKVGVITSVTTKKRLDELIKRTKEIDETAFIVTQELDTTFQGYIRCIKKK